jgi:CHASE2 domain-containing sensor protein
LLLYSSHLALGVFQLAGNLLGFIKLFLAPLRGGRRLLQGEFRTHILYFVLSFALLNFYLHRFIKNTKKLVSTIVVIFVGLLLSCFIILSINGWFL